MRYYGIALAVLLLDQVTKWLVLERMHLYESIPVVDGIFYITSHRNRGAAFGILQDQQWLFIPVTLIVVAVLIYYLWVFRRERPLASWSFSLILGGAIGNLIDRVRMGEVVDFLDFKLINYPIFNVADSAIVIGVALFVLDMIKNPAKETGNRFSEVRDGR
ncbi:signal peptidase II [Planifilum fulgidum]|uniref:Lipoprotein signal peptidase n=1 Tax=Planifilum fulgidum TaxID=201973 RepID=A0A1I2R2T3_9BACL|nr:signal peptidase II [Planifilum fulgidum]MBO2495689.1 lipoprotein signal peptidase [Bacillota bacterium]MBO2533770.1 lipoprotein signal peptidase [Thermoactinomycetaceae bacterium]SFG34333.1 signal peptidase II [Planifilum fulgidum]